MHRKANQKSQKFSLLVRNGWKSTIYPFFLKLSTYLLSNDKLFLHLKAHPKEEPKPKHAEPEPEPMSEESEESEVGR